MQKGRYLNLCLAILFSLISLSSFSQKVMSDTKDNGQRAIVTDFALFGKYVEMSGPIGVALECKLSDGSLPEYFLLIRYKYLFPQTIAKESTMELNVGSTNQKIILIANKEVTRAELEKKVFEDIYMPTANGTWYFGTSSYTISEKDIELITDNIVKSMRFVDEDFKISPLFTYGLEKAYKNISKRLKKK